MSLDRLVRIVTVVAVLVTAPLGASASLIGDTIGGCLNDGATCPANFFFNATATVADPAVEFSGSISDDIVSADFSGPAGTTLTLMFNHLRSFHTGGHLYGGFGMLFDGIEDTVTGLTLLSGNSLPISGFSFDDHGIFIQFHNVFFPDAGIQSARFELTTVAASVPEPSVLGLLGAIGIAAGLGRRRRTVHRG